MELITLKSVVSLHAVFRTRLHPRGDLLTMTTLMSVCRHWQQTLSTDRSRHLIRDYFRQSVRLVTTFGWLVFSGLLVQKVIFLCIWDRNAVGENLLVEHCKTQTIPPNVVYEQEAHHKVELDETPQCFILKRCRYASLEKFEDAFDTALDLIQTKTSDAAYSAVFRTSINADRKQPVMSYPVRLYRDYVARMSLLALVILR